MALIAISGRLGSDPRSRTTTNDKAMCTGFLLGDVEWRGEDEQKPLPLNVIAFGRTAEILGKHGKGQFMTVSGRLQGQIYNGEVRYSIVADSIVSARAAQPGAKSQVREAMDSYQHLYTGEQAKG